NRHLPAGGACGSRAGQPARARPDCPMIATGTFGAQTIKSLRSPDRLLMYLVLLVLAVLAVFPFYWMLIGSVMTPVELFARIPKLWPTQIDTSTYARIFQLVPLGRYFLNSVIVAGTTTVVAVLIASAAGYAFARLTFFGKGVLFG